MMDLNVEYIDGDWGQVELRFSSDTENGYQPIAALVICRTLYNQESVPAFQNTITLSAGQALALADFILESANKLKRKDLQRLIKRWQGIPTPKQKGGQ